MRLSEIKGDRVFDVIADIVEPACNIAQDEVAGSLFNGEPCPEDMTPRQFAMEKAKKAIPVLMRSHKDDLIAIMATINGITPNEYSESLTMAKLFGDLADLLTDEDLLAFLS